MDTTMVSTVLRDGLMVAIKLSMPILLLCMAVGVIMAIFQAVTQIHEQTLAFILKLIVIIIVMLVAGSWMLQILQEYSRELFLLIAA